MPSNAACADTSTWNRPMCIKKCINRSTWQRCGSYIIFSAQRSCQLALAGSADCCREGSEGVAGASSESKQTSLCVQAVGRIYGSDDATVRQTHLLRFCFSQFWMEGPPSLRPINTHTHTHTTKKSIYPFLFGLINHKFSLCACATKAEFVAEGQTTR